MVLHDRSARNEAKAKQVLQDIGERVEKTALPPVEVADLVGDEEVLRAVVRKTRVVITCAGPFEKYSQQLVKLCAELGVHYADITGKRTLPTRCLHPPESISWV